LIGDDLLTGCLSFFSENRYLLILTENYAALRIVQQHLLKASDDAVVIFGSGFPNDQEYTQVKWTIKVRQHVLFQLKIFVSTSTSLGLSQHKPNQGLHGDRKNGDFVELGRPLRKSLRRSKSGIKILV